MTDENPSAMSHVSLGTNDFKLASAFYDKVLATLGIKRIMEHEFAVAYGKVYPEFWINVPLNDEPATTGNGIHIGFMASSPTEVDAFHMAAIEAGAVDEGAPGPRLEYGEPYYGCFCQGSRRTQDRSSILGLCAGSLSCSRLTNTVRSLRSRWRSDWSGRTASPSAPRARS